MCTKAHTTTMKVRGLTVYSVSDLLYSTHILYVLRYLHVVTQKLYQNAKFNTCKSAIHVCPIL